MKSVSLPLPTPTLLSLKLNPQFQNPQFLSTPLHKFSSLKLSNPHSPSLHASFPLQNSAAASASANDDDDNVIGDCIVFEEGAFEDPYADTTSFNPVDDNEYDTSSNPKPKAKAKPKHKMATEIQTENLVPEKWREVQAEINITKKQRRKIALELEFNSRVEKKKKGLLPIRSVNLEEYEEYREAKLAQLKPLVLDNPSSFPVEDEEGKEEENGTFNGQRVAPKNPRWAVYGRGFDAVADFFHSGNYEAGGDNKKSEGPRKLFTKEEKVLLNRRIPDVPSATSSKWLPLHTLAASGEFYLVDALLKHNMDINAMDADGLTALHKAIVCKKQAITSYLLRESADPFVRDTEGATLMHYAVQAASIPAIKLLHLYNVDINLQDNDGWTPLHLAVQARRTDIVKLLLIKGADKTLKNQDGLTPFDLCLYSGRDTRTYELIKLLKLLPKKKALTKTSHDVSAS